MKIILALINETQKVSWCDTYPSSSPATVSLDAFYNRHLNDIVRTRILDAAKEEAEQNLGMPATYTVFEAVKESADKLLEGQEDEEQLLADRLKAGAELKEKTEVVESVKKEAKKEQLTKAQKRAAFKKTGTYGEDKPRGYDWVDVIRHLSQTGGVKQAES